MARQARLTLGGVPHHVLQRGNDGAMVFRDDADRERFLGLLREHAPAYGVAVHGYVLLPSEFQLLATPQSDTGLPRWLQQIGRAYVRAFNSRHQRSGTLWEGRYRSTLVDAEAHALDVLTLFDTEPLRLQLAAAAGDYAWSSHAHYAGLAAQAWLLAPPAYWALGNTPFAREGAYRQKVQQGLPPRLDQALRQAVTSGWLLGSDAFKQTVEARSGRRVVPRAAGRPRKLDAAFKSVPN